MQIPRCIVILTMLLPTAAFSANWFQAAVFFSTGSKIAGEDAKIQLDLAVAALAVPSRRAVLLGHADSSGSKSQNQVISLERANTIAAAIIAKGIRRENLTVVGCEQPVGEKAANWRERRVDIFIVDEPDIAGVTSQHCRMTTSP